MNPVAIRLLNQQLIAPQFGTPAEVVRYMGAMQAQEYRMMRWAVAMRTRKPSHKTFKKTFDEGEIIRLHLMRGTWQLVSAEDYWMLIDLCAPKALAAIKGWMLSNRISISEEEEKIIRKIIFQAVSDKVNGTETIVLGSQQYTQKDGKGKANVFANAIKHDFKSKNPTTRWSDIIKLK